MNPRFLVKLLGSEGDGQEEFDIEGAGEKGCDGCTEEFSVQLLYLMKKFLR